MNEGALRRLLVKIVDFNLAELAPSSEVENPTKWEAPEIQMMKSRGVTPSLEAQMMGDMYSYGVILGEMKLGHEPSAERDEIDPTWPAHFIALLKDLWAQAPSERPTAMKVLRRLLQEEFKIMNARIAEVPGYR